MLTLVAQFWPWQLLFDLGLFASLGRILEPNLVTWSYRCPAPLKGLKCGTNVSDCSSLWNGTWVCHQAPLLLLFDTWLPRERNTFKTYGLIGDWLFKQNNHNSGHHYRGKLQQQFLLYLEVYWTVSWFFLGPFVECICPAFILLVFWSIWKMSGRLR